MKIQYRIMKLKSQVTCPDLGISSVGSKSTNLWLTTDLGAPATIFFF